jgi:dihydroorotase
LTGADPMPGAEPADLRIAGGTVVDPARAIDGPFDVIVRGDRIEAVVAPGTAAVVRSVLDASGCLVTAGLIDLHAHVDPASSVLGLDADSTCLPSGVTTVIDAGTAGCRRFDRFVEDVVRRSTTRIRAFVNLSAAGIPVDDGRDYADDGDLDIAGLERAIRGHPGVALGVKVRLQRSIAGDRADELLSLALDAAASTGTRVMVHTTDPAIEPPRLFGRLRPGDVITHVFHGKGATVVDGAARDALGEAQARSVIIDVGHGAGSFSFEVARSVIAAGIVPDTISTDLHTVSRPWPVIDLPMTMSKLLALGMPLHEVVAGSTARPAAVIGARDELGDLAPGTVADLAILAFDDAPISLGDSYGARIEAPRLAAVATVWGGAVVHDRDGRWRHAGSDDVVIGRVTSGVTA